MLSVFSPLSKIFFGHEKVPIATNKFTHSTRQKVDQQGLKNSTWKKSHNQEKKNVFKFFQENTTLCHFSKKTNLFIITKYVKNFTIAYQHQKFSTVVKFIFLHFFELTDKSIMRLNLSFTLRLNSHSDYQPYFT